MLPTVRKVFQRIEWRKVMLFLLVLCLTSLIVAYLIDDYVLIVHSLFSFVVLVFFLVMEQFILEYKAKEKSKQISR